RRRLAGAVRSEKSVNLPRNDLERHLVDRRETAVLLDEIVSGDHLGREGLDQHEQHPEALRRGIGIASGAMSVGCLPTTTVRAFGPRSTARIVIFSLPTSGRMAACRSRPPRASRTCVASAGN